MWGISSGGMGLPWLCTSSTTCSFCPLAVSRTSVSGGLYFSAFSTRLETHLGQPVRIPGAHGGLALLISHCIVRSG